MSRSARPPRSWRDSSERWSSDITSSATSTPVTPGSADTAAVTSRVIVSRSGQPATVRKTSTRTRPSSATSTAFTMPRSVIGRLISGSLTVASEAVTSSVVGRGVMPRCYVGDRPNYDWGVTAAQVSRDRVTPEQLEVWRSFLRAHSLIIRRLETDLMDRLVESDDRRLRMSDLAERVMLSPSGLTRLVDRMVEAGLLCREPSENDARGSYAVLTDHGFETLRSATGTHLRGIRDYVLGRFTDAELLQISRYLARLVS